MQETVLVGRGKCLLFVAAALGALLLGLSLPLLLSGGAGGLGGLARRGLTRISLLTRSDELARTAGSDSTPLRFVVRPGDTAASISEQLMAAGLVHDAQLFVDYAFANGLDVQLKAGDYFLNQTQSIPALAQQLANARGSALQFRVFAGWRMEQVAAAIDNNGRFSFGGTEFLQLVGPGAWLDPAMATQTGLPPGASLEGYLFPDSYSLPPQLTALGLRQALLQQLMAQFTPQMLADAAAQGLSLHNVLTLAAIVERESLHEDEDARIAGVYRRRLAQGMKLDADPTVQYALSTLVGSWWPQITAAHYSSVISPWNTYLHVGLPPGPIANPGLSAIRAAIYPAPGDELFFRAACDGSGYHVFARSYAEHLDNGCPA